jgi:hypothetical protein
MPSVEGVLTARLHGRWDDRALDYDAAIELRNRVLRIAFDEAKPTILRVPVDDMQGAVFADGQLLVHRSDGSIVTLSGSPHLEGLRHRLEAEVCTFPAQTLSLRGFGSERSAPGSDHDRWFEGLLFARRVAEESRTVDTQRRAFDAERLRRHAATIRETWAAERCERPADRRALIAELEEIGDPYAAALAAMGEMSPLLRRAPDAAQFESWRTWTITVQRAFRAADDAWSLMVPVLADSRGATGSLWRKLLRGDRRRSGE